LLQQVLPRCGDDSTLLSACGLMLCILGEYDRSLELALRAVTENPNDSQALCSAGVVCLFAGDLGDAATYQLRALKLSPNEYVAHGQLTCVSHIRLAEGRFEESIDWAKRSLAASPHYTPTWWMLAAANAHLGRLEEARRGAAELLRLNPPLTVAGLKFGQHARDPRRVEVIFEGLRLAGFPES
jgi:Flp pilus assembly protein TadD